MKKHIIVGTAGHIDHGKTSLIEALSGFQGDTLEEEKKRGITIDLSFSNLENEDTNVAFIDVPGHEKLLKNMIAGAFGFDACMVAIDANEGIMPQTNEHLEILNLLEVNYIIVALTKSDLAENSVIEKQIKNIKEYFKNFDNIQLKEIIPVSIYDKESIEKLKHILFNIPVIPKTSNHLFRYYIDRSFSLAGAGQIVTGTVLDGNIKVGEKIYAPEINSEFKVKNLQVHEKDVEEATNSQRTAINLQGNSKSPVKRGLLLCKKGYIKGFNSVDVFIQSISGHSIKHNSTLSVFIGTKQVEAKILFLENKEEQKSGYATLNFKDKLFLVYNEPFVISISGRVIGGGRILNPINDPIKKRVKLQLLSYLKERDFKSAFSILCNIHKKGFGLISSNQRFGLNHDEALQIAKEIDNIFVDEKELVLFPLEIKDKLKNIVKEIYTKNEYALLSASSLALKIKWASISLLEKVLEELTEEGFLNLENGIYKNANVEIKNIDTHIEEKIFQIIKDANFTPDAPYNIYDSIDCDRKMGDTALKKLTKARRVVRLTHNLFVESKSLSSIVNIMREIIKNEGYIDVKNFKNHYNFSRKYLIAYLDYLDNFDDIKKEDNRRLLTN